MSFDAVVHVIDDDEAVRQGIAFLLTSSGLAVRTYESATAFLGSVTLSQRGCIVTDVHMPGIDGVKLISHLKRRQITMPVIIITGHADVKLAIEAMRAGAEDFIEKPFDNKVLLDSIRKALAPSANSSSLGEEVNRTKAKLNSLSPREREVLTGLVAGRANKAIAFDLKLSPRTVEVHRANLMNKMAASSLSDLVRMEFTAGYAPLSAERH